MPLVLAVAIVASQDRPYGDEDPHETYAGEMAALRKLAQEALREPSSADDTHAYVDLLQALLGFEGVDVWAEHLDGLNDEEFEVPCPACASENFIAFGTHGYFSTTDSRYMCEGSARKVPLAPRHPSEMADSARRLHARAIADGRPGIADKLTFVFGDAHCADCG
ncbi:hypothetical protein [Streptomyces sp. NPDC008125]|uniref:hypothetical protein n=1 Tax=Streptomyces sp. NPDC008125 TaxID=3364811 RepID=UPI0036EFBCDD